MSEKSFEEIVREQDEMLDRIKSRTWKVKGMSDWEISLESSEGEILVIKVDPEGLGDYDSEENWVPTPQLDWTLQS